MQVQFDSSCLNTTLRHAVALALASLTLPVAAMDFETDGGWKGTWNTTVSAAAAWRAQSPDASIVEANDAATCT